MDLSIELKQTQKLSPQMIQSMEILQMGIQELQEFVEEALMENPTLELQTNRQHEDLSDLMQKLEWLSANDRQNVWYYREDTQDLMDLVSDYSEESLYDHLRAQLDIEHMPAQLGLAVDCVLTGLNHAGYLEESSEELAARCNQQISTVVHAEQLVQKLEPAGIGARTLSECLALQLTHRGENGLALTIVQNHLEDMAQGHYNRISKRTGASRKEIHSACRQIRALDPKPGLPFSPRVAPGYIVPDLLVTEERGQLVLTVGDAFLPALNVSAYYQQLIQETEDAEVRNYLLEKVRQANWTIKSIEQRKATLMRCAEIIVAHQKDFFHSGTGNLQPMSLSDVANVLNTHESTVSRTVKNKYIQCKYGTFSLSHFFCRAVSTGNGNEISQERAMHAIRSLIEQEDKNRPLSDQRICEALSGQGFILSRRTIAKYREEMGIPSASGRREF